MGCHSSKATKSLRSLRVGEDLLSAQFEGKEVTAFEVKRHWLYNEWEPVCQFSSFIQANFNSREELHPDFAHPNRPLIEATFDEVRGKWALWQEPREKAQWHRIEANVALEWMLQNVEILYPSNERFKIEKKGFTGIVLWEQADDPLGKCPEKKYKLYEGNHRISAWKANGAPESLRVVIYVGTPLNVPQEARRPEISTN